MTVAKTQNEKQGWFGLARLQYLIVYVLSGLNATRAEAEGRATRAAIT